MVNLIELTKKLEKEVDLPAGRYFEVTAPNKDTFRISILEESGACTTLDWSYDGIDLPYPIPENFLVHTKTEDLAKAVKVASELLRGE